MDAKITDNYLLFTSLINGYNVLDCGVHYNSEAHYISMPLGVGMGDICLTQQSHCSSVPIPLWWLSARDNAAGNITTGSMLLLATFPLYTIYYINKSLNKSLISVGNFSAYIDFRRPIKITALLALVSLAWYQSKDYIQGT